MGIWNARSELKELNDVSLNVILAAHVYYVQIVNPMRPNDFSTVQQRRERGRGFVGMTVTDVTSDGNVR
jgi:hypothetical protein